MLLLCGAAAVAQPPMRPDTAAQRDAMKKLDYLTGKWTGEAVLFRGPGQPEKLIQSEEVQSKLDGLLLLVEGTGRDATGKIVFRALATISYDDIAKKYFFRAYNDGRYLDTELSVNENGWEWRQPAGPGSVRYTMRRNGNEWVETGEFTMGDAAPRKTIEMRVHKQ